MTSASVTLESLLALVQRLNISLEAAAALAAHLRLEGEQLPADPEVRARLSEIASALGAPALEGLSAEQLQSVVGTTRGALRQALELLEQAERAPGWVYEDPAVLQSQGRVSMFVAAAFAQVVPQLSGLAERLAQPDCRLLDIGTGVGWLAVAMARTFARLDILGIDIWEPSLTLARSNVAGTEVAERIELRRQDARDLTETQAFDVCWCAGPFLPKAIVPAVLERVWAALRPGGWLLFGLYAAFPDPLAERLNELRIVRWGGHPWREPDAEALLAAHGFTEVRALERAWQAPIRFVVGRRPVVSSARPSR